jgi:citrate synthase
LASHWFYNELEENMTRYTRIVSAGAAGDGSIVTYLQAMLEQTADNLGMLQKTVARSVESNAMAASKMSAMSSEVAKLAQQMKDKLRAMEKISASPDKLYPVLADLVKISKSGFGMDDRTRDHIRGIDAGMVEMADRISSDIRLLARTIAMNGEREKPTRKGA